MRLFIAVELDPAVVRRVAACGDELRGRAAARAPRARVTWVPPEHLHVTVRFIGEVEDAQGQAIVAAVERDLGVKPFDVIVQGVGTFPERGAPRVIWVGIADGGESLAAIEREIVTRLGACGIPGEERPYHPHVTLARVREAAGLRPGPLLEGCADRRFGTSRVDAITLFQSRPSAQGQVYVPLRRRRLTG